MIRARALRILRIASTILCGITCALFIALWIRSYTLHDVYAGRVFSRYQVTFESCNGHQSISVIDIYPSGPPPPDTSAGPRFYLRSLSADLPSSEPAAWYFQLQSSRIFVFGAAVPHCFCALVALALAAMPWIKWSRSFSLRTALIVVTFVSIALGLIDWSIRYPHYHQ
jgi:hypothetical protein